MTRDEAARILSLASSATIEEVRSRHSELYNDFQVRLTNAPTANLKKTYQQNIEQLSEAAEILFPGFSGGGGKDLPSSSPIATQAGESQRESSRHPIDSGRRQPPKMPREATWPRWLSILLGTAALVLIGYVLVLRAQVSKAPGKATSTTADTFALADLPPMGPLVLSVENPTSVEWKVDWVSVACVKATRQIDVIDSRDNDKVQTPMQTWTLAPGARTDVRVSAMSESLRVLTFSMHIADSQGTEYFLSGSYRDLKQGVFRLPL